MSKGGSSTTKVEVPDWLQQPAERAIGRAEQIGKIGYTPYYGPEVAAFNPMQQAAFDNTNSMASAFGMGTGSTQMPAPQTFAGGVQGYSSGGLFHQALNQLRQNRPGQFQAIKDMFINPVSGAAPKWPGQPKPPPATDPQKPGTQPLPYGPNDMGYGTGL
jgi:hypothetical protein